MRTQNSNHICKDCQSSKATSHGDSGRSCDGNPWPCRRFSIGLEPDPRWRCQKTLPVADESLTRHEADGNSSQAHRKTSTAILADGSCSVAIAYNHDSAYADVALHWSPLYAAALNPQQARTHSNPGPGAEPQPPTYVPDGNSGHVRS